MQLLAFLLLGIGLPVLLALFGLASWAWLGLGAAAWAAALFVKAIPGGLVWIAAEKWIRNLRVRAGVWGLWSAACELTAAALVFLHADPYPDLKKAIAFGVGAGSVEVIYVLVAAMLGGEEKAPEVHDAFVNWSGVTERALTLVSHVASRGILWAALLSPPLLLVLAAAVAAFAMVDGVAVYGHERGWNWIDPALSRRFYSFLGIVCAGETLAFLGCILVLEASS